MDQRKVGGFLRELRKETGLTQEQLAEELNVSGRTVSRWETGSNLPDLDVLVALADRYGVDIREILDGARRSGGPAGDAREAVLQAADYCNEGNARLARTIHLLFLAGVVGCGGHFLMLVLDLRQGPLTGFLSGMGLGLGWGALMVGAIYTSRHLAKIRAFKKRLLKMK